jgi:hypothetical protein
MAGLPSLISRAPCTEYDQGASVRIASGDIEALLAIPMNWPSRNCQRRLGPPLQFHICTGVPFSV